MFFRRSVILAMLWAVVSTGCISSTQEARADARRDIRRGDLELRIYGIMRPTDAEYSSMLQNHLGVKLRRVGSCTVSRAVVRDADAYNEVMTQEIEARHGKGVFENFELEAQKRFAATQAAASGDPGNSQ